MKDRDEIDVTALEQRIAEHHEKQMRMAAMLDRRHVTCQFRRCRRNRMCMGPMVKSHWQEASVRALKFMGYSGLGRALRPFCASGAGDGPDTKFAALLKAVGRYLEEHPRVDLRWLKRRIYGSPCHRRAASGETGRRSASENEL